MLRDGTRFEDLRADYLDRLIDRKRLAQWLLRRIEALRHRVELRDAA